MKKKCKNCGSLLDENMFKKNNKSKDGLYHQCKLCDKKDRETKYKDKIKEYSIKNRDKINVYSKQHYYSNIDYYKNYDEQRKNNPKRKIQQRVSWIKSENKRKQRRLVDKGYRLARNTGASFSRILAGKVKSSEVLEEHLNYNMKQLKEHIESQFTPEMSWDNYGTYWELDHIIPQNQFYYESYEDEQFKLCWALNNLRPLTIHDNRSRSRML